MEGWNEKTKNKGREIAGKGGRNKVNEMNVKKKNEWKSWNDSVGVGRRDKKLKERLRERGQ